MYAERFDLPKYRQPIAHSSDTTIPRTYSIDTRVCRIAHNRNPLLLFLRGRVGYDATGNLSPSCLRTFGLS